MSKKLIFKNDANTTLSSALLSTDTVAYISNSSVLPDPTTNGYYYLAIESLSTGAIEYIQVISKVGPALTIIRGLDGSVAQNFAIGDYIGMRVIAAQFYDIISQITSPDNISIDNPGSSYTPDLSKSVTIDLFNIANTLAINNPVGSPQNFTRLLLRLRTTGTAQNLTFGNQYVNSTAYLPSHIPADVSLVVGFTYNSRTSLWECTNSESIGDLLSNIVVDSMGNMSINGTFTCNYLYPNHALGVLFGGTGATTRADAINNLLPSQIGNATNFLTTDGTNASWQQINLAIAAITSGTIDGVNIGSSVAGQIIGTSITATSGFFGSGANLTGTATSLNIGGNAATASLAAVSTLTRSIGNTNPSIATGGLWLTSASGLNISRNSTNYVVLDSGNYTTYVPPLTGSAITGALGYIPPSVSGSGATGTWGINITGNAGTSNSIANSGGWSVTPSGTKLYFAYNGVNKMSLSSAGNLNLIGDVYINTAA